jgi:hypothetical protein
MGITTRGAIMYDELERAYGARTRRGPSALGWVLIGLTAFLVAGVAGVAYAIHVVKNEVEEFAAQFEDEARDEVPAAIAGVLASTLADVEPGLIAADPEVGNLILSNLRKGRMDEAELRDLVEGSLLIRTGEGDVRADLRGNEEGGSLVVRTPDGDVRMDLARRGEGGELVIEADGETVRFGAGEAARHAPAWVHRPSGMPERVLEGFSASSSEGAFGVVSWETDGDADALVEAYGARLEDEGYQRRGAHRLEARDGRSASVFATDLSADPDRTVFFLATREDGVTRVVLGWGDGMDR